MAIALHDIPAERGLHAQVAQRRQQEAKIGLGGGTRAQVSPAQLQIEEAHAGLRAAIVDEDLFRIEMAMATACAMQGLRGVDQHMQDVLLPLATPSRRQQSVLQAHEFIERSRGEHGFPLARAMAKAEVGQFGCGDAETSKGAHGQHFTLCRGATEGVAHATVTVAALALDIERADAFDRAAFHPADAASSFIGGLHQITRIVPPGLPWHVFHHRPVLPTSFGRMQHGMHDVVPV